MIERIPEAHRDAFERLMARDLVPETSLLADVDAHLQTICDLEERTGRGIDLRHAEALADRSRVLLRSVSGLTVAPVMRSVSGLRGNCQAADSPERLATTSTGVSPRASRQNA